MNWCANLNIMGLLDHSEPSSHAPKTAVGTAPSSRTIRALPVASPSRTRAAMPASTSPPMASSRRFLAMATATPRAGKIPLRMSADSVLCPAERNSE